MSSPPQLPDELVERLRSVRSVGAITGAGISHESGIRTYRGRGGLYDDPEEGDRTVEALSAPTLVIDPDRTWAAIAGLARQAGAASPSLAHRALVEIESKVERFVLLTQNVDGLHRRAGSRNVIEIHGDILETECLGCGRVERLSFEELQACETAPRCEDCDGLIRPRVVLFGELLPADKVLRIRLELYASIPDLLLVVGTSALFPYITDPVAVAQRAGSVTIEINPEATASTDLVEYHLRGKASEYLPLVAAAL